MFFLIKIRLFFTFEFLSWVGNNRTTPLQSLLRKNVFVQLLLFHFRTSIMKHKKTVSEKEVSCTSVKKLLTLMEDSSPQLHGKQVSLAGRKDKVEFILIF